MNSYDNQFNHPQYGSAAELQSATDMRSYVSRVMRRVYGKMCLGLLVTTLASLCLLASPATLEAIFASKVIYFGLIIAELGVVIALSGAINRLSSTAATVLFYLYAILNGVTLTSVFFVYTVNSIALTFGITTAVFGAMTIYGYVTRQDLTKLGTYLFMALIGIIIASIVNIFLASSALDWCITIVGVIVFVGLTAWDTQKITQWAAQSDPTQAGKLATMGALSLYLDFVNLFLYLLRIFGQRND